jgi:prepilin-type N-terminal cleavage/methylation domain-containing protein
MPASPPLAASRLIFFVQPCFGARRISDLDHGFSLVEVLIAVVICLVAVMGTAAGFNLITQSIKKSSGFNEVQIAIDNDISRIRQISRTYTPCSDARGGVPESFPACGAASLADITSEYYFPVGSDGAIADFFDACGPADTGAHFTVAFQGLIDSTDGLPDDVSKSVEREDSADDNNHNFKITYSSPRIAHPREVVIAPVASSWCP